MPDFESMSDAELRAFKHDCVMQIRDLRAHQLEAEEVLQRKRAIADARWRRAVQIATELGATGDEHDVVAQRFYAMDAEAMDRAAEDELGVTPNMTREERRAASRARSATVVAPPAAAAPATPRGA